MSDLPVQNIPKVPTEAPIGMLALTGVSSSAIGDQVGDAIGELVSWVIALKCQCAPPPDIIKAVHTLCVASIMIVAFYIHFRFIRNSPKADS